MQGNSLTNGVMTFSFQNIMLPDSGTDMLNSMGYVCYKARLKPGLAPLTEIKNTAYIYFDYNAPVVTNTTLNTIEQPGGIDNAVISGDEFSLFPNPANTSVTVQAKNVLNFITIYNSMGMLVYQDQYGKSNKEDISLQFLKSGIYFVELRTADRSGVVKLLKN